MTASDPPEPSGELVRAVGGDRELAALIDRCVGPSWRSWMSARIPALGGRRPESLLASRRGRHELRAMLMKMP